MVLPLFAAFVKGAAEAGEDMIDFKAKNDAERAALAAKYNMDFENRKKIEEYKATLKNESKTKKIGPYMFQSDLQDGSKGHTLQALTTLNAGIKNQPEVFEKFMRKANEAGTTSQFLTRVKSLFAQHQSDGQKVIKFKDGAEGISHPTEDKFSSIFSVLNRLEPNRQQSLPPAALSPNIRNINGSPVNEQATADPQETVVKNSVFASFLSAAAVASPEVQVGAGKLATLWKKKTGSELSQQARNRFSNTVLLNILSQPLKSKEGLALGYAADVLDQDSPASLELRRSFGNTISGYIGSMPLSEQSAAASEVTNLFRAFAFTTITKDEEKKVPVGANMSPITKPILGDRSAYYEELRKRNPAGKGEFEKRASTGRANKKVVDMLGTMQELLVKHRDSGVVGGNFLQAFARRVGGFSQLFSEFIDVSLFEDRDSIALRSALGSARGTLAAADAAFDSGDMGALQAGAVFDSLNQIVAFALAQIVQTGADKISNADVENMKTALANSFSSTKMQVGTLDSIRRMALKNLMAYDGYMTSVTGTTGMPKDYGDFIAAQLQYNTINETVSSFRSSQAFKNEVNKVERRTPNLPEGYTSYKGFFKVDSDFSKLSGGDSMFNVITAAWTESAEGYQPEEGRIAPDFVTIRKQLGRATGQERDQLRRKYLNFAVTSDTQRSNDLSAKIYNRLSTEIKEGIVAVRVLHVKNLGFIPFAKVRVSGNNFEMKRMTINNTSLFSDEEDVIKAFENQNTPVLKAAGGYVSISDRLKTLQKPVMEE